jgi:hypothetical protein
MLASMRAVATTVMLVAMSTDLFAHHGYRLRFDFDDLITVEGVVTVMCFVSPHSRKAARRYLS